MLLVEMHKIEDMFGRMYDGYSHPGTKTELNVIPATNLIRSIGFEMDPTHTSRYDGVPYPPSFRNCAMARSHNEAAEECLRPFSIHANQTKDSENPKVDASEWVNR